MKYLEVSDESLVLNGALVIIPVDSSVESGGLDVVAGNDVRLEPTVENCEGFDLTHLDLEGSHELLVCGSSLSEKLSPVASGWDYSTRHISESKSLLEN